MTSMQGFAAVNKPPTGSGLQGRPGHGPVGRGPGSFLRPSNPPPSSSVQKFATSHPLLSIRAPASLAEAPLASAPAQPSRSDDQEDAVPETPQSPDRVGMGGIYRAPLHFKFLVPHSLTGLVLGYQGSTVKTINRETGTFIQLTRPNTDTNSPNERTLVMAAPSVHSAAAALRQLLDAISSGGGLSELEGPSGVIAPSGTMVLRLVIPQICAGTVVGPAGETVKGLGARHGVWAAVEARDPRAAFHPFRILVLAGDSHSSLAAAAADAMSLLAFDSRYAGAIRGVNSTCFRTFPVPFKRVGLVMGAKGKHVQALQDMLRVKIGVSDAIDSRKCKHISVWGPVQSVEVAVQAINISISTWNSVAQRQQRQLPVQSTANNQEEETDEAIHQQVTNDVAGYDEVSADDVAIAEEE